MNSNLFSLKRRTNQLFVLILGLSLFACSSSKTSTNTEKANALRDGVVALSRPVPQAVSSDPTRPLLGFMPSATSSESRAVILDRASGEAKLLVAGTEVASGNALNIDNLAAGTYRIKLVQQDPVWYAPDSYFQQRELNVPEQFAAERFRRGALGNHAIFLDNDLVIHSSLVQDQAVGGIQIADESLARFFEGLSAGQEIVVK